jgi:hypothetical protein
MPSIQGGLPVIAAAALQALLIPKIINSDATPQHLRTLWCDAPKMLDVLVKLSKN